MKNSVYSSNTFSKGAGRHSHCPVSRVQLLAVYIAFSFQLRVTVFITEVLTTSYKPDSVAGDSYAFKMPEINYSVRKHLPSRPQKSLGSTPDNFPFLRI